MKNFISLMLLLAIFYPGICSANQEAAEIMEKVWKSFLSSDINTEVETSKMTSSKWSDPKEVSRWIDYESSDVLLVLEPSERKPDGVLMQKNDSQFGFSVKFQKRKRVKSKSGSFDAKSNGTEFTYFDISRFFGENAEDYKYSFWTGKKDARFTGVEWSIKATPKERKDGDYHFRVFHITEIGDDILAIKGIEYFCDDNDVFCKIQVNVKLELYEGNVWRADKVFLSSEDGTTAVIVKEREFNREFGNIDKKSLEDGHP